MTKKALVNPNLGTLTRVCLALAVGLAFSTTAHAQILSATSDGTGTQRHKVDQGKVEIRINVTPGKGEALRDVTGRSCPIRKARNTGCTLWQHEANRRCFGYWLPSRE